MRRRDWLRSLSSTGAAVVVGGCLAGAGGDVADEQIDTRSATKNPLRRNDSAPPGDEPTTGSGRLETESRTSQTAARGTRTNDEADRTTTRTEERATETARSGGDTEPAALEEKAIKTESTSCGGLSSATVSTDGRTVLVDGVIEAPNPCHRAVIERVNVEHSVDEVSVVIGVEPTGIETCRQCVGSIRYTVRLEFTDVVPRTVKVVDANKKGTMIPTSS